jgi:hypothetical protein
VYVVKSQPHPRRVVPGASWIGGTAPGKARNSSFGDQARPGPKEGWPEVETSFSTAEIGIAKKWRASCRVTHDCDLLIIGRSGWTAVSVRHFTCHISGHTQELEHRVSDGDLRRVNLATSAGEQCPPTPRVHSLLRHREAGPCESWRRLLR